MIVRINEIDAGGAEAACGWGPRGLSGPLAYRWPAAARGYEVLILEQDEQGRPLAESFRLQQVRRLIASATAGLKESAEAIVVRLDGPLVRRELAPAFNHLVAANGSGRFAISEVQKFDDDAADAIGSARIEISPDRLAALCDDLDLGLERWVRLRVFAVPRALVNPLLDTSATDDERWPEILAATGFVLSTIRGLRGLHVITTRLAPEQVKSRLFGAPVAS